MKKKITVELSEGYANFVRHYADEQCCTQKQAAELLLEEYMDILLEIEEEEQEREMLLNE